VALSTTAGLAKRSYTSAAKGSMAAGRLTLDHIFMVPLTSYSWIACTGKRPAMMDATRCDAWQEDVRSMLRGLGALRQVSGDALWRCGEARAEQLETLVGLSMLVAGCPVYLGANAVPS
jgi:hypothetical protein